MTMLSDRDIAAAIAAGEIVIEPYDPARLQPASYDLALGGGISLGGERHPVHRYAIGVHEFLLGETAEVLTLAPSIAARIEGKSSLGRKGLFVHVTAGFIDPGWSGRLTLEFFNASDEPIKLRPGMPISQLSFYRLSSPVLRPYGHPELGSHYQGATGVEASKI